MASKKAIKKTSSAGTAEQGFVSRATLRGVHLSPRKARLVVDMIRGRSVERAVEIATTSDKKAGPLLKKLILSAAHNAKNVHQIDLDELFIKQAYVDAGQTLKRYMPRAQGRATPIRKRYSAITVVLDEMSSRAR